LWRGAFDHVRGVCVPPLHLRRLRAGGVAFVDQNAPFLFGCGCLAPRLLEPAMCGAAASGAARTGQDQAQPEQSRRPDDDAAEEEGAGGAGDVDTENRESAGELMGAAAVRKNADDTDYHRGDEDDEFEDDHGVLLGPSSCPHAEPFCPVRHRHGLRLP
jgi:hypothetical protein